MNPQLRENKNHGSSGYPYSQYRISGVRHSFQFPVHWHDEMELIYVRQGHLRVNIGGTDYMAAEGDVLIVNPGQLHLMGSEDRSVCYHTLLFPIEFVSFRSADELEQEVFRPLRTGQRAMTNQVPKQVLAKENLALLDRVIAINEQKDSMYQLETRLLILRFFMEVLRSGTLVKPEGDASNKMQKELLEYIRMHYRERISLSDLAEQFHLTPKYLSRYFKEHFHLTLSQYIAHLRLDHAQELLETTDLSVTDIAMQSGFSGVSFFIRSFTQANGVSPLKWRNRRKDHAETE